MGKLTRFSILLAVLTALASCSSLSSTPSQGTQAGVQITVAIQEPQRDALTGSREVEVRASVTGAPRIDKVELIYQGQGGASGRIPLSPQRNLWKGKLPSNLPSDKYTLKAKAYVGSLSRESEEVVFTYDKDSPLVAFLSPVSGSLLKGVVTVRVQATDNVGVARVQLLDGGMVLGESTAGVNGVFTFDVDTTRLEDGDRTWRAVAWDTTGNVSDPAEITVRVRNQGVLPTLSILLPQPDVPVGVQVTVKASVTKKGDAFTWQPTDGHNLWVRVYDYRGHKVAEAPLLADGAEPPDNADSVAEVLLDLGNVPNDLYRFVVEGQVWVEGRLYRLFQERMVEVQANSNLPPALVVYYPRKGSILPGGLFYVVADVTDDSNTFKVHAVEVRLIRGSCQDPQPENYLLRYEAARPYGLFVMSVPLDGHPYIEDGDYCLRVVAIDNEDFSLRNIQEFGVTVNRAATLPTANISVDPSTATVVVPGTATWRVRFSSPTNYVALLRKDGVFVDIRSGSGSDFPLQRTFYYGDEGTWDLVVVFGGGKAQSQPVVVTLP